MEYSQSNRLVRKYYKCRKCKIIEPKLVNPFTNNNYCPNCRDFLTEISEKEYKKLKNRIALNERDNEDNKIPYKQNDVFSNREPNRYKYQNMNNAKYNNNRGENYKRNQYSNYNKDFDFRDQNNYRNKNKNIYNSNNNKNNINNNRNSYNNRNNFNKYNNMNKNNYIHENNNINRNNYFNQHNRSQNNINNDDENENYYNHHLHNNNRNQLNFIYDDEDDYNNHHQNNNRNQINMIERENRRQRGNNRHGGGRRRDRSTNPFDSNNFFSNFFRGTGFHPFSEFDNDDNNNDTDNSLDNSYIEDRHHHHQRSYNPFGIVVQRQDDSDDFDFGFFPQIFPSFGSIINSAFRDNFASNFSSHYRGNFFDEILRILERNRAHKNAHPPATDDALKKLKKFTMNEKYCKKSKNGKYELPNCCICLSEIGKGEKTVLLPCGHMFHWKCCLTWLKTNNTCPMCRFEIK